MKYQSFSDMLSNSAALYSDRTALISIHGAITYAELVNRIREKAAELRRDPYSCIGMIAPASAEWIITMFASVIAGKRTVLLDHTLPVEFLSRLIRHTEANRLFLDEPFFDKEELAAIHAALTPPQSPSSKCSDSPDEGDLLFFTSGTTEMSRAVVLTSRSLCSSAWNGQQMLPCTHDDIILSLIPLVHVFGFVCTMLWPISQGATVAVGRGVRYFTQDPPFYKPTILPVVPSLAKFLLASNAFNPELKTVLIGASACDRETISAIKARGISVRFGYGLTETSSGLAISIDDNDPYSMALCPDSEVTIADDGEILVKTSCMMKGYFKNKTATRSVLRNGVLHTGDLGHFDRNDRLIITGRKKDILILPNGKKIFCVEWENELSRMLNTHELAVILSDGHALLNVVGDDSQKDIIFRKIQQFNRTKPFDTRINDVIMRQDPLPRTATGKIKRWAI